MFLSPDLRVSVLLVGDLLRPAYPSGRTVRDKPRHRSRLHGVHEGFVGPLSHPSGLLAVC